MTGQNINCREAEDSASGPAWNIANSEIVYTDKWSEHEVDERGVRSASILHGKEIKTKKKGIFSPWIPNWFLTNGYYNALQEKQSLPQLSLQDKEVALL